LRIAPIPHLRSYQAVEAFSAFRALGPKASSALPDLIRLLDQNLPAPSHGDIVFILADIGPAAKQAVPALVRELQGFNPIRRGNALYALGCIYAASELVVPRATKALGDSDPYVRRHGALALKAYGAEAESSVPTLVEKLQSWNLQRTRGQGWESDLNDQVVAARGALRAIDPEAAANAGVK
jgi:HEAT repeat protein